MNNKSQWENILIIILLKKNLSNMNSHIYTYLVYDFRPSVLSKSHRDRSSFWVMYHAFDPYITAGFTIDRVETPTFDPTYA